MIFWEDLGFLLAPEVGDIGFGCVDRSTDEEVDEEDEKQRCENLKHYSHLPIQTFTQRRSGASQHMTKTSIILICVYIILIACVYIQQFNFVQ